jgi:2-iminoacetate synthase ThiH
MSVTQVIEVAERGRIAGATECLFTLGDRPEAKYPAAKQELRSMGFESTVDYLAALRTGCVGANRSVAALQRGGVDTGRVRLS